jgi:hypothetical protein
MPQIPTPFGKYIDTIIRLYASDKQKQLTEYIRNDLSNDKNDAPNRLSSRQIARMRDIGADEFPEGKGLLKLLEAQPGELENLNPADLCNRLLVPWQPYAAYQQEMIQAYGQFGLSITIAGGRTEPLALSDSNVITAMTDAIRRGVSYTFLYPNAATYQNMPEEPERITRSWINVIQRRIVRCWEEQREQEEVEKNTSNNSAIDALTLVSEEEHQQFEQTVKNQVRVLHTNLDTDFWFLIPSNYIVLYNIEPKYEGKNIPQYGAFRVEGRSIIRASQQEMKDAGYPEIHSEGWLRMLDATYDALAESYETALSSSSTETTDNVKAEKQPRKSRTKSA